MSCYKLSALDVVHVSTVLEDCIDQLAILGRIMPNAKDSKNDVNAEVVQLIEDQKLMEKQYEMLMTRNQGAGSVGSDESVTGNDDIPELTKKIHSNTQAINKIFRRNKFVQDANQKVQVDRRFLFNILEKTLDEIKEKQSFHTLVDAVKQERDKKQEIQAIVAREEESRKTVRQLQRSIIENKKEQETEVKKRNELIAYLKDQLQEMKAKTTMESKYIKKDAELRVICSQKKCIQSEETLKEEIIDLNKQIESESRCNSEIESFLRTHHSLLEEKVEHWMEKYDNDVEAKQAELDALKSTKATDLTRLQELTQRYHEYSRVVQEDKAEKERLRKEEERELEEFRACVGIQSWWRGVMVRKQLGPYKPKKKGKGKGKKGGKGGKKGKKK